MRAVLVIALTLGGCASNEYSGAWSFLEIRWNSIQSVNCSNVVVDDDGKFACGNGSTVIVGSISEDGVFSATVNRCGDVLETVSVTGTCDSSTFCAGSVSGSCVDGQNNMSFTRL